MDASLKQALALMATADPRVQCAASFDDYHVPGLTYVNLRRAPEITAKLYIFKPGGWAPAAGKFVVHPHDHAYGFDTLVLAGVVANHLFSEQQTELFSDSRWTFTPRVGFSDPQPVHLKLVTSHYFGEGDSYSMSPDEIHTIEVDPHEPTLLFLVERMTTKPRTSCYLPPDAQPPQLDGLYKPMTTERYAEALATAAQMIR